MKPIPLQGMQLLMDLKENPEVVPVEWDELLDGESGRDYFLSLMDFIRTERATHPVYPEGNKVFEALRLTPPDQVKIVLLGQDPYHGPGQAHGLAFSVPEQVPLPPSLRNIYKELTADLGIAPPTHGNLGAWARQGVLLLNTVLTVRAKEAGSHQKKGWENFTDAIVRNLSQKKQNLVFILWGNHALGKEAMIDATKHCILKAAHPSPLSAHRGFFGCRHFSAADLYLEKYGISPINWAIR